MSDLSQVWIEQELRKQWLRLSDSKTALEGLKDLTTPYAQGTERMITVRNKIVALLRDELKKEGIMNVEVVRINRLEGQGSLKAFADISLYGTMVVKGLRVVDGSGGLFVDMPREQGKDGRWYAIVTLLSRELKQVITDTVLEAYSA